MVPALMPFGGGSVCVNGSPLCVCVNNSASLAFSLDDAVPCVCVCVCVCE